jgi:hypothetical protein
LNIVIVASKRDTVRHALPHILPDHAQHDVHVVSIGIWGPFRRRMPRDVGIADHPHVGTPLWKAKRRHIPCTAWNGGRSRRALASDFDVLAHADWTICITDPYDIELHSAAMMLTHAAGLRMDAQDGRGGASAGYERIAAMGSSASHGEEPYPELRWLPMWSHDARGIKDMWEKGLTTHSTWFRRLMAQGSALRHFDNAFEINARALIDPIIRGIVPDLRGGTIGKAGLQLLYHLAQYEDRGEGQTITDMEKWNGTGRYEPAPLGSIETRMDIIESLIAAGLLERRGRRLRVGSAGRDSLARLGDDLRDVDQTARLRAWAETWPASRPNMERYILDYFGRLSSRTSTWEEPS